MRSTRGNSLKLQKPRHRLNVRDNYFANRVVNLWNSLPDNVVTAPSVDSFKRRLDKHWAALPSMYDPEYLACIVNNDLIDTIPRPPRPIGFSFENLTMVL